MKNYIKYTVFLFVLGFVFACNDDDDPVPESQDPTVEISLASSFEVERYVVKTIEPTITITDGEGVDTTYQWSITVDGQDSVIGNQSILQFISPGPEEYTVNFTVTCGKTTEQASTIVTVLTNNQTFTAKATELIDYNPAPSQNLLWNFFYMDKETVAGNVEDALDDGNEIDLGTFGGYMIAKFDHTVINVYGKNDFNVQAIVDENYSPLAVMVAYDANGNGEADDDEWYEIAGSEYNKSTTVKDYEITYYRPDSEKDPVPGEQSWQYDTQYLKWTSNQDETGYITRKTEGTYFEYYYPNWKEADSYTLKGTKLAIPVKDVSDGEGTDWNVGAYEWGYGGIDGSEIDIDWAVDADGNKVFLPGIDFVKVYVPTFVELGKRDLLTGSLQYVEDLNLISGDDD